MTVATPRQVNGVVRLGRRKDWWDADQIGKPITGTMAEWLRKGMISKMPGLIQRALARRGLLLDIDWNDSLATRWTEEGQRVRDLLGPPPARTVYYRCVICGRQKDYRLRALGDPHHRCIQCATEGKR